MAFLLGSSGVDSCCEFAVYLRLRGSHNSARPRRVYFADERIEVGVKRDLEHCTDQDLNLCQIRLHCRVTHAKIAIDPARQSGLSLEPYAFNPKVKPASNNRAECTAVPKFGERAAIQAIELFAENAAPTLNCRSCVEYPIQSQTGPHK
jgi:hypothetical protein